jgi:hypothetical protein
LSLSGDRESEKAQQCWAFVFLAGRGESGMKLSQSDIKVVRFNSGLRIGDQGKLF